MDCPHLNGWFIRCGVCDTSYLSKLTDMSSIISNLTNSGWTQYTTSQFDWQSTSLTGYVPPIVRITCNSCLAPGFGEKLTEGTLLDNMKPYEETTNCAINGAMNVTQENENNYVPLYDRFDAQWQRVRADVFGMRDRELTLAMAVTGGRQTATESLWVTLLMIY